MPWDYHSCMMCSTQSWQLVGCGGCLSQICYRKMVLQYMALCLKESRGIRICSLYLSTGMCSTDEAPWLVIHLFILFCTVAFGCNLPWIASVPCVAWLSVPRQRGGKGSACALGVSAMWKVKQVKQHKVPGYLFRNDVGTGRVLRSSCCGSVVNFY